MHLEKGGFVIFLQCTLVQNETILFRNYFLINFSQEQPARQYHAEKLLQCQFFKELISSFLYQLMLALLSVKFTSFKQKLRLQNFEQV